tara:strand:+ start:122 stop:1009 length:888 start_codon:yes stop_codon:yes gene_type:complete
MKKSDKLSNKDIRKKLGFFFLERIKTRLLRNNKNWLAICCGDTGSGKSYSALALANAISPRGITIKRNVVFNPIQFMERVNNKADLKKGDIIIFDEAGVGMSSREWYSVQNKLLGSILQTFRNLNLGVIFTTPNLSFIDVQARKLFHNYMETSTIDYEKQIGYLRVYDIQHNSRLDKTYYKTPKFTMGFNKIGMKHLGVKKLDDKLCKEYEKVKTEYTENLNQKALEQMKDTGKKYNQMIDTEKICSDVKKDIKTYIKKRGKKKWISAELISANHNIGRSNAYKIKHKLESDIRL